MTDTPSPAPSLDLSLDLGALRGFLRAEGVVVEGPLRADLLAGGRSNLTYRVQDEKSCWVLRRPPTGGLTPSAHDVRREHTVMSRLRSTPVPVADAIAFCPDESVLGAPFTVAEYVAGTTLRTRADVSGLRDEEITACTGALVGVLAALHTVDPDAVGLRDFGRGQGYVTRQVALWRRQWELVKPTTEDAGAYADVAVLHAALTERIPAEGRISVVHGDYRVDNTILARGDAGRVLAVIDWEMSTLGDPLTDLAMMCVYRDTVFDLVLGEQAASTAPRMADADELAELYTKAVGRELGDWPFYLALAHFKLAVIAAGIAARHRQGVTAGEGFDRAGEAVRPLMAQGLTALRAGG
jgi:aminoglycoside phosphotransferase (APT) family kinase protein